MPSCKFPTHSESGRSGQGGRVRVANGVNRETSSSSSLYFVTTLFLETFSFPFAPVKAAPNRCGGLCSVILVTPRFSFSFFFPSPPFASWWRYCAIASLRETSRPGRCASHVFRCLFLLFLLSFLRFIDFTRKKKKKQKKSINCCTTAPYQCGRCLQRAHRIRKNIFRAALIAFAMTTCQCHWREFAYSPSQMYELLQNCNSIRLLNT